MRFSHISCLLLLVLALAACGDNTTPDTDTVEVSDIAPIEITIRPVGDQMVYEQTTFSVEAGQEVTLILENVATLDVMIHNVVILSSNDDAVANRVGIAGVAAGEASNYIPEDEAIFAYTPLAQPGETVQITFTAPSEPGTYRYLCTYPGHFALMQGTMVVT